MPASTLFYHYYNFATKTELQLNIYFLSMEDDQNTMI